MEKQFFAVDAGMVVALAGIGITVSEHTLYLTVTPRGAVRIVPINCTTENEYTRTKEIGLLDGIEQWVRWWVYPMGKVLLPACYAVHLVGGRWEVVRPTPTATNTADLGAGLR